MTVGTIARTLVVSVPYVSKVLASVGQDRRNGSARNAASSPWLQAHEAIIRDYILARPDSTLVELCAWLREKHEMEASVALMAKTMAKLGLALKKRRSMRPNRNGQSSPQSAQPVKPNRPRLTRRSWSSSMKPGRRRTWSALVAGRPEANC